MEKTLSGIGVFRNGLARCCRAVATSVAFALTLIGTALGQQITITGTVIAPTGAPLREVAVKEQGSSVGTFTNASGKYSLTAPANGVLTFSILGRRAVQTAIAGRTTIDVTMEAVAYLADVVVTAYTEQRRADVTGAVASVDMDAAARQTSASVLQRLDATTAGVTVNSSGSPGSRSTVRVRGVSSFQNNDPLYIVDGVPVQETYANWLNPNDISSIQVLKDASAASIYGARASNGVILIETTRRGVRGPPRATLRVRTGIASPVRGYDDFLILDALQYHEVVRRAYVNAGQPVPTNIYGNPSSPSVPAYTYPNNCGANPCTNVDESTYSFPNNLIMPGSAGTNWWDAVFGTGFVGDYHLDISGGSDDNAYLVTFGYFDQEGTAAFNRFRRGSIRVNTSFKPGRFSFGENLAIAVERGYGGQADDGFGEGGILGKNILMQPVVPIYDIRGNFASGKAVGLGNNTNPLKFASEHRNDLSRNERVFGNAFAGVDLLPDLSFLSRFGFNLGQGAFTGYSPPSPENAEPTFNNAINENSSRFMDWTWTNTLSYRRAFLQNHNISLLLGQEANRASNRFIAGGLANLINTDLDSRYIQDALGSSPTVSSTGGRSALLSFFGKADYNFADRYLLTFTLRHDGSSNLGRANQWGTFPAFGVGWRLSNEPFMAGNQIFSHAMLRFGWGITGNQLIPSGRIVNQFGGGRGDTYYDIRGNNTIQPGFRQTSLGNPDLRWEESRSMNVGADLSFFDGMIDLVLDVYQRRTDDLLFDPRLPGTAGIAAAPIVNIGEMKNRGIDFSISHRASAWSVTLNGSHYRNKIVKIADDQDSFRGPISTRFGNQVINRVGHPIGAFYGYIADGLFRDAADVAAHANQPGKAPGRIKFRDVNGDGVITATGDRTIIGDPHPDFTAGLDVTYQWRNFDASATLFGTFGNDIFDVQKEFYVFRNFSTNVRRDLLTDSWTPENPDAKYPRLDQNDNFSRDISSFYIEDGSYIRLRNLQVGYAVPPSLARWLPASRLYVQAENLFTITDYEGLDPALPAANVFGPAGDIRDQYRGVDRGSYPSNRTFSFGIVANF